MKLKTGRHTSALKEARKNLKRRAANKIIKSRIKTAVKKVDAAVTEKNAAKAGEFLRIAAGLLDKAAKKKIIHRKTVSRKISHLSRRVALIK